MLIASVASFVLMAFALHEVLVVSLTLAVLVGFAWAGFMLVLDRWLVAALGTGGGRRLASVAMPRIFFGLLLALVFSTPLVIEIFRAPVEAQIVVIQDQDARSFYRALSTSPVGLQIVQLERAISANEKVIDSGGYVPVNPQLDPRIRQLTKALGAAKQQEKADFARWTCELYGGSTCHVPAGNGPLAHAAEVSYEDAVANVNSIARQINARTRQLTSLSANARTARLAQAKAYLPGAKAELAAAIRAEDAEEMSFSRVNESDFGLLVTIEALDQLSSQNAAVSVTRFLMFIITTLIICLPVIVKLMQRPGNYERILQTAQDYELRMVGQRYLMLGRQTRLEHILDQESAEVTALPARETDRPDDRGAIDRALRGMTDKRSAVPADDTLVRDQLTEWR